MLSSYIVPKIPLNPLVDNLGLLICLRMIAGARCPYELTVPVTDDVLRQPVKSEDLLEENLGYLNCIVLCWYGI
jgi:hypothetical protein